MACGFSVRQISASGGSRTVGYLFVQPALLFLVDGIGAGASVTHNELDSDGYKPRSDHSRLGAASRQSRFRRNYT